MSLKNNKLSCYKIKKIMECFCLDIDATRTALLLQHNRKTINRYFQGFREAIEKYQLKEKSKFVGEVELDESYFGATRLRGRAGKLKRGRGTHRQPVFGIFERQGRIYTEIICDCSARSLLPIIRGKVAAESIIHTDGWRGYDGLVDMGYDKHIRVNKTKSFAQGNSHINGIEAFWSFVKGRLAKFNGVKKKFPLHLRECEWRYHKTHLQLIDELSVIINQGFLKKLFKRSY